jgi:hypothetical protein
MVPRQALGCWSFALVALLFAAPAALSASLARSVGRLQDPSLLSAASAAAEGGRSLHKLRARASAAESAAPDASQRYEAARQR